MYPNFPTSIILGHISNCVSSDVLYYEVVFILALFYLFNLVNLLISIVIVWLHSTQALLC